MEKIILDSGTVQGLPHSHEGWNVKDKFKCNELKVAFLYKDFKDKFKYNELKVAFLYKDVKDKFKL